MSVKKSAKKMNGQNTPCDSNTSPKHDWRDWVESDDDDIDIFEMARIQSNTISSNSREFDLFFFNSLCVCVIFFHIYKCLDDVFNFPVLS